MIEGTYIFMSAGDFKTAIREAISEEIKESVYNRFESVIVDSKTACKILQISDQTLFQYLKEDYLQCEPRPSGGDMKFRLSYLLKIDIVSLRRMKRYGIKEKIT